MNLIENCTRYRFEEDLKDLFEDLKKIITLSGFQIQSITEQRFRIIGNHLDAWEYQFFNEEYPPSPIDSQTYIQVTKARIFPGYQFEYFYISSTGDILLKDSNYQIILLRFIPNIVLINLKKKYTSSDITQLIRTIKLDLITQDNEIA
jgi:hypothetical protein